MIPAATPQQKQELAAERRCHHDWLARRKIDKMAWTCGEVAYTGLIFSALIEPGSRAAVCRALLGEAPADGDQAGSSPVAVRWPNRGVDLIVEFGEADERRVILMEHKRFRSPSHAPGYRTDPDALWQTDQVYESVTSAAPPDWFDGLGPAAELTFLVLDVHGKTMDQMYPGGRHNKAWRVTGYQEFGSALRGFFENGTRGLVPLLSALHS
jgi:hypothetical protein